jgi:hypothetical protein
MWLIALAVGLLVFSVGCSGPVGAAVPLLTGVAPGAAGSDGAIGCFTNAVEGPLIADATYGVLITGPTAGPAPVAFRPGFTARRVGSEVEVLSPSGGVVAVTGKTYRLDGAYIGPDMQGWPGLTVGVFWACDRVTER